MSVKDQCCTWHWRMASAGGATRRWDDHPAALGMYGVADKVVRELVAWIGHGEVVPRGTDSGQRYGELPSARRRYRLRRALPAFRSSAPSVRGHRPPWRRRCRFFDMRAARSRFWDGWVRGWVRHRGGVDWRCPERKHHHGDASSDGRRTGGAPKILCHPVPLRGRVCAPLFAVLPFIRSDRPSI